MFAANGSAWLVFIFSLFPGGGGHGGRRLSGLSDGPGNRMELQLGTWYTEILPTADNFRTNVPQELVLVWV